MSDLSLPDREALIETLAERYLDDLQGGASPDREALLAVHPDIAAALDRRLALVEAMHRLARSHPRDDAPPPVDGPAIRVRCPHCGNAIQVVGPPAPEVTCRVCGSSFPTDPGGTAPYAPDLIPQTLGKFRVLGVLGRGTFGTVYKALDPDLGRTVAIKVPRVGSFLSGEEEERFLREARHAAQLHHPGVVKVLEIGRERGMPYIVSDFVDGPTLADLLTASRLDSRESADLVARIADALAFAHASGIIHRDVKPSNILLDSSGRPLVTDFGLARRDGAEAVVTLDGQVLGTPAYMAPEQAAGDQHRVGPRSDVYSLGVVLYVLLTGELPFRGNTRMLIQQVLHEEPKPPRRLNDKVPRDLETVCLKAMAKESSRRYGSAAEFASDLRRFLADEPIHARRVGRVERAWRWCRRDPLVAGLVVGIAGSILAGVAFSVWFAVRASERAHEAMGYLYAARINLAQKAWGENEVGRMLGLLDRTRPGPGEPDLRGWEWDYLWRLCHDDLATLPAHPGGVKAVAFGPDGRLVASCGKGSVKLWDTVTRRELRELRGHEGDVHGVAFSPEGRRLATAGQDATVRLWDLAGDRPSTVLSGHPGPVLCVAFSPDGRTVASGGKGGKVLLWDVAEGRVLRTISGPSGDDVEAVAFSPDGLALASASLGEVRISGIARGELLRKFEYPQYDNSASGLAFSPDGSQIAAGYLDVVVVWDVSDGRRVQTLKDPSLWTVTGVAFSPDGRLLLAGSWDNHQGTVRLWDVATGKVTRILRGHTDEVNGVAFSPDGRRIASASLDGSVKIWDTADGQRLRQQLHQEDGINSCSFSPDGSRLAVARGPVVAVIDAESGQDLLRLRGDPGLIRSVSYSPDGLRIASGGIGNSVNVWDSLGGSLLKTLIGHEEPVTSVAFSPDGRLIASGSWDRTVRLWDATTGREVKKLLGHADAVTCVAFRPDGRHVASASGDTTVNVWDVASGRVARTIRGHTGGVEAVGYSPNGRWIATASTDGTMKCWDSESGGLARTLTGHIGPWAGKSVTFTPDGRRLASADSRGTTVYDLSWGQEVLNLGGNDSLAFSPDGRRLALERGLILDARSLTDEVRIEREARGLVEFLACRPMLGPEIRRHIRLDRTISEAVREKASVMAGKQRDDPQILNHDSWSLVSHPGRAVRSYRQALEVMEEVCRREPENAGYLTSLGAAYYRVGRYESALAALTKADNPEGPDPHRLAILAMVEHRLGRHEKAVATLARLRTTIRDLEPSPRPHEEAQVLLREAVISIIHPELPSDVFVR